MNKKGNLFLLIKSLSKSEKRYLRIYASSTGRDANYLLLFDAIDELDIYNEGLVREKLKGKKFLTQLHVTKIYLTELILKSLRNYHADASLQARLLDLLRDVEILFDRELYDLCYYKIQKAEELATKYEKLPLLVEILSWKRKLGIALSSNQSDIDAILHKEDVVLVQMKRLNTYWQHTTQLVRLIDDDVSVSDLRTMKFDATYVLQSQILHFHILYGLSFIKGDIPAAEKSVSDLIELLESFPDRIKDDPHAYVTAISNKISLYLAVKRWEQIPALLTKIREVPSRFNQDNESKSTVWSWIRTYNVELEMYRDSRQLDKAIPLIAEIQRFITQHERAVSSDYILLFYYQFANIYFLKGEFGSCLHWLNNIMNERFGNTRKDIQSYARILNLMVHFELGNIIVLRYALDSCRRFLKKTKVDIAYGSKLLAMFSKLCHAYPKEYKKIFSKVYSEINSSHSDQQQDYIDIKGWIEGKLGVENIEEFSSRGRDE